MTLMLPELATTGWQVRSKADPAAVVLADRHYSRRNPGTMQIGPPGRLLVLLTGCERAVWITHWPNTRGARDGLDAWRCTMFRNEGAGLSSELIRSAMAATAQLWSDRPADGWLTWVDRSKIRSTNPGYCFIRAGWTLDRTWSRRNLIRLRAAA